jgi:hypothetical protein
VVVASSRLTSPTRLFGTLCPFSMSSACTYIQVQCVSFIRTVGNVTMNRFVNAPPSTWGGGPLILSSSPNLTFSSNKSPIRCRNFPVYYPDFYLQLNMFWAFLPPIIRSS